jgi:hypothetical protein
LEYFAEKCSEWSATLVVKEEHVGVSVGVPLTVLVEAVMIVEGEQVHLGHPAPLYSFDRLEKVFGGNPVVFCPPVI